MSSPSSLLYLFSMIQYDDGHFELKEEPGMKGNILTLSESPALQSDKKILVGHLSILSSH